LVRDSPHTRLDGHAAEITSSAYAPDGKYLASGDRDGKVRLWMESNDVLVTTLVEHAGEVRSLAFSPDGEFLACGYAERVITIWKIPKQPVVAGDTKHVRVENDPIWRMIAVADAQRAIAIDENLKQVAN
jgi:WD40 repeat protein